MRTIYFLLLALLLPFTATHATPLPQLRISVENSPSHVQTRAVKRFADTLAERTEGRLDIRFHDQAALYRDKDVLYALAQGKVEMAVPGTWHVMKFEPNIGIFLLPCFYGRPARDTYDILNGPVGTALNNRVEKATQARVIGSWIDLGHAHLYGVTRKITAHEDISGLRIRVAGGAANEMRITALGGTPFSIAWPDLPIKLEQKVVDGILTTHETVRSAKLWEHGIRYAFEDREYFPQYIPLIRNSFWNRLPDDLKKIITRTWEEHVDQARAEAAEAQLSARDVLLSHGVEIVTPSPAAVTTWREHIFPAQPKMVQALRIDPELLKQTMSELPSTH